MRNILIIAVVLIGSGVYMAQLADRMSASTPAQAAAARSQPQTVQSGLRTATLQRDASGHFRADARVDGRAVSFMVDTGATVIALTPADAARLGIRPSHGDYTANVSTANGTAKAARARLDSVDVGGVVVRDVDALVMPEGVLGENLLGMAFLSRLKRFEYANGRMVIEQ